MERKAGPDPGLIAEFVLMRTAPNAIRDRSQSKVPRLRNEIDTRIHRRCDTRKAMAVQKTIRGMTPDTYKHRLSIRPVPPYDFDLSAGIFSREDRQFRTYEDGHFKQALRLNGEVALVIIASTGTVDDPSLQIELKSHNQLGRKELERARELVIHMLNLDIDLRPFYEAVKGDLVMAGLVDRLYGLKSPTTVTVHEALVQSIIEQQISLAASRGMTSRLIRKFGERHLFDHHYWYLFPTPEKLAKASIATLQQCGLSRRKAEYIRDISRQVASGELDLEKFESYEDIARIREELKQVRGIGDWTAEMTMIRGLHKMDSIPADDVGLQAKLAYFYGKDGRASGADLREVAEHWGKYRGLGGYYMIMAHHVGLEPEVS